ncbi:kinesin-8, putative [Plasmodium knowlesi strain H]|uniref:Kinesin-8, putative n=3 Tax=Plasmodium knowlesi TaxID=5850 RepID=A0A5K1TV60_PLAKH|nr:kinesin-8, putative [Plasmodium knowlesi strain H]OTN66051.1 putative Kinesin [Plasmodium knowlesi]CAA9987861.1 kinesin-8, putative [Plasmodium knowlesi strain H]SBO22305.1 kinesin-8, putative [Plasmodium knowlesi strain H]SBO28794.1 kinesin-8, putative [Plasmodium knowlesi strain H]VVS77335.1 kinesin-8, putative [Plasmodium knowlesi strain H]|eukprot:XP_002258859.1 kinesin, putative [Plasmodium knowlesi strain H]
MSGELPSNVITKIHDGEGGKSLEEIYVNYKKLKKLNGLNVANEANKTNASNEDISRGDTIFYEAQSESGEREKGKNGVGLLHIDMEEESNLKKKKKKGNDGISQVSKEKCRAEVSNAEIVTRIPASCVTKDNATENKKINVLTISPEFNDVKRNFRFTHRNNLHVKKSLNDVPVLGDSKKAFLKSSHNLTSVPLLTGFGAVATIRTARGEERLSGKKKFSPNSQANSIISHNDRTLKIFCNAREDGAKSSNPAGGNPSRGRLQPDGGGVHLNGSGARPPAAIPNEKKRVPKRKAATSVTGVTSLIGATRLEVKTKNGTMESKGKNRLSVTKSQANKIVMDHTSEYPITSKNIYDSIYIPQINIKNIFSAHSNSGGGTVCTYNTTTCADPSYNSNGETNALKREDSSNLINTLNAYSNVKVAVRIKPISESEENIVSIFNKNYVLIEKENQKECYLLSQKKKQATYVFDVVFDVNATQENVFLHTAKPLIPHVFKGVNGTVFAYGATGSGKTYTMLDDKNQNGIVQLSLLELFTIIKEKKYEKVKVLMSFLEVYNETIRDLLGKEKNKPLEVQEDAAEVRVSNLCEVHVESYQQAMILINEGVKNRKMSPTRANKVSSRSHAILQIYIHNEVMDSNMNAINYKAKLCFVDLAGSERASATSNKGERFKEGSYINQSLLALANCINSLASNKNIPKVRVKYRDSKLTHLLKNSLEGNCLVVMIANINPSRKSFQESNNTLKYAFRARNIKLCATIQTNDNKESDVEKILKRNDILQKEYDLLLHKYGTLKECFANLKVLFQLYKNVHHCYQRKENASTKMSILGLKQNISVYEQLILIKSEEIKKKVDSLPLGDDQDDVLLLNIFDSVVDKNLDHFIRSNSSALTGEEDHRGEAGGNDNVRDIPTQLNRKEDVLGEGMTDYLNGLHNRGGNVSGTLLGKLPTPDVPTMFASEEGVIPADGVKQGQHLERKNPGKKQQLQTFQDNLTDMQNSILMNTISKKMESSSHVPIIKTDVTELFLQSGIKEDPCLLLNEQMDKKILTELEPHGVLNYNQIEQNSNRGHGVNDTQEDNEDASNGKGSIFNKPNTVENNLIHCADDCAENNGDNFYDVKGMDNAKATIFTNPMEEKNTSGVNNLGRPKREAQGGRLISNNEAVRSNKRKFPHVEENIKHEHQEENSSSVRKKKVKNERKMR